MTGVNSLGFVFSTPSFFAKGEVSTLDSVRHTYKFADSGCIVWFAWLDVQVYELVLAMFSTAATKKGACPVLRPKFAKRWGQRQRNPHEIDTNVSLLSFTSHAKPVQGHRIH